MGQLKTCTPFLCTSYYCTSKGGISEFSCWILHLEFTNGSFCNRLMLLASAAGPTLMPAVVLSEWTMPQCIWRPRDLHAVVNSDPAEVLRASTSKARWDPGRSLHPARPNWPRSRSSVPLIGLQLATEDKTHTHTKKATATTAHHLPRLWPSF